MSALIALEDSGEGEVLVLVHGLATDRRIWSLVAPALAAKRRVISVDVPGFGHSAPAGEEFDLDEVAQRISDGLAQRGISGPFDLVGHSLGGGIAMTLAAAQPQLVRRLVLVAPAGLHPMPAAISSLLAAGADALLAARRSAAPLTDLAWGRRVLLAMTAADGSGLPPTLARQLVDASATALRTGPALQTITTADLRPVLAQVSAPLGVIWGESDRTIPLRDLDEIIALRPEAPVALIPGAGHVPMVERSGAFIEALETLLEQLPASSPPLIQYVTSSAGETAIVA